MLNNSWKKYGGIRNTEQFHNLTIGTLVADQVLLREKVSTETIFNTLLIANGGVRTTSIVATNNVDICNNLVVYNDVDAKSKIYFSSNNTNNVYFFKHLSTNLLGLNTQDASATLHIVAADNTTDVFRATSLITSVRNILAENSNRKGITVNSDNTNSYIKFFNANTVDGAADATLTSTNAGKFTVSSASNQISATGGSSVINSTTTMDVSSNTGMTLRAGTVLKLLSNSTIDMSSNSTLNINSATLLNLVSPSTNIYSNLHLSNRNTVSNIYNETLVIYDNSYGNYLYDAYENSSAKTGNALTMVSNTNTSNTFMNIVTPSKLGLSVGGGSYINDTTRSMGTIGVMNSTGNYLPTHTIISGNTKAKYYTTTGFNTYAPRSEQYLIDINGATHITNGEINKVLDISYEIIHMNFSKYNSKYGIAAGTPSSYTSQFVQTLHYTTDGGLNWTAERFDPVASSIENSSKNITISVYDATYSIIGANNGFSYYTRDGGVNWYKFSLPSGQKNIQKVFIQQTTNSSKRILLAYNTSTAATIPTTTEFIGYIDVALSSLPINGYTVSTLNTFTPNITTINSIDGYNDVVYLVGAGIQKYQVSTLSSQYNIKNSNTYNYIHVYDTSYAVAVGVNILSYTRDGTNWTDVVLSSTTLNSVYVYNSQYAVAVGINGKIYYTKDTNYATWSIVPNDLLHSGGNAGRINGSANVLRNVHMPDINTLLISNIKQSYVLASAYGLSKVYNCYFPNLFNRGQNSVLDLSGTMNVAGDMNIVENGNLYVDGSVLAKMDILLLGNINTLKNVVAVGDNIINGNLFVALDTSLNARLVVGSDITTNRRLFTVGDTSHNGNLFVAYDTSLNSRLVVGSDITTNRRLFAMGDTSLNGNLFAVGDTTLNSRLVVGSDITTNKRLFTVGDTSHNGNLFVAYDTSLNARLVVGSDITTNKRLFTVGDTSHNGNLFVAYDTSLNSRLVVGSDITTNRRLFALGDASFNGNLFVGKDIYIAGRLNVQRYTNENIVNTSITNYQLIASEDISLNGRLCIAGDASINQKLFVAYDTSLNSRLVVGSDITTNRRLFALGDTSLNGNLFAIGDTSLNSRLVVGSDITANRRLFAIGDTSLNGNLFVAYDTTLNSRLVVGSDITTNKRLFTVGDTSLNGKLFVAYDTTLNSRLVVGSDITTNKRLFTVGDTSLNGNLFVAYDTSLNARLVVGSDITANRRLFTVGDTFHNGNLFVALDTSLNGNFSLNGSFRTIKDISVNTLTIGLGGGALATSTAVGYQVLKSKISGNNNTAFGYNALTANTTGELNTAIGSGAMSIGTTASNSTAVGSNVLLNSTGLYNVGVGNGALQFTTSGDLNVAIGYSSIGTGVGGSTNTAVGASTLTSTTGSNNVAVGYQAAQTQTNVIGTVAVGSQASKVSTVQTTAVGYYALFSNTSGTYNTSIGGETLLNNTNGANNTSVGYQSLRGSTSSSNHTAVGYQSLASNNIGANNTAIGYQAGFAGVANTVGSNNTYIGYQAQANANNYNNSTALGVGATITGSNQVVLGTASEKVVIPGNVGIGTTAPTNKLHIFEPTGTAVSGTNGTIILEHDNPGGTSSILFKSKVNGGGGDYGYIYFMDDLGGLSTQERGALCIGVENDLGNNSNGINDVLVLNRNGCYVGIGMTNPSTALQVNGTTTSNTFNALSDYRIKTNVVSLEDTSITVDNLRPVMYTNTLTKQEDIGFIAHEVQEHIPFLVSGEKDGEHHQSINYNGMIGILTKEIQELKKENRALYERLSLIESTLNIA